jgi:hypothetical protein
VSWGTLLPFIVLTILAVGVAVTAKALVGEARFARVTPAFRVAGIAVIVILVTLRTVG